MKKFSDCILFNTEPNKHGLPHQYAYIEAQNSNHEFLVFNGMRPYIQDYLCDPIYAADVTYARDFFAKHDTPFDYDMWMTIVNEYDGYLPIEISTIPEGSIVPPGIS